MRIVRRTLLRSTAALAAAAVVPRLARAKTYPTHPVRLIVGYPPGGQIDIVARITAQWLGEQLGQAVVVENKPGVGGSLGAQAVVQAPADGYTLFFATSANAVNPSLFAHLPYDFLRGIAAVAPVNRIPLVIEANPAFADKTVADLIADAKAKSGPISIGSPSAGTPPYLAVELVKMRAGINFVHVPYFGENQMVTDLLGGQLMVALGGISSVIGHIKAGKLRALAVTTPTRLPQLPDVAAVAETLPGFDASGWSGIVAPQKTPLEIIDKLAAAVHAAQADPKFKERLNSVGVTELTMSPDDFAAFIAAETAKWGKVVKFAGLKAQ